MSRVLGILTLVLVTLIWGTTFIVIKDLVATLPVSLVMAVRFSMASVLLGWVKPKRADVQPSILLGLIVFVSYVTLALGLSLTSASNAAFITG